MRIERKRRRQEKTNYRARMSLLKSEKPRIVARKTNRYVIAQYVKSRGADDFIVCSANSKELVNYGWPEGMQGSLKSLPACYLTGMLLGKRIIEKEKAKKSKEKEIEAVFDIGLANNIAKSRIFALLKGIVDSGGIAVAHKENVFPDDNRIMGKHLRKGINLNDIKEKITK